MEELTDSDLSDDDPDPPKHPHYHRAVVRRIRREYRKLKALTKRRCIQLKVDIRSVGMRALLDCGSEINLISRAMVKRLGLSPSSIHEKACGIANTKLETF